MYLVVAPLQELRGEAVTAQLHLNVTADRHYLSIRILRTYLFNLLRRNAQQLLTVQLAVLCLKSTFD